jgi:hypothetical protein
MNDINTKAFSNSLFRSTKTKKKTKKKKKKKKKKKEKKKILARRNETRQVCGRCPFPQRVSTSLHRTLIREEEEKKKKICFWKGNHTSHYIARLHHGAASSGLFRRVVRIAFKRLVHSCKRGQNHAILCPL